MAFCFRLATSALISSGVLFLLFLNGLNRGSDALDLALRSLAGPLPLVPLAGSVGASIGLAVFSCMFLALIVLSAVLGRRGNTPMLIATVALTLMWQFLGVGAIAALSGF